MRRGPHPLHEQHDDPADQERRANHPDAGIEHPLHERREQGAGDKRRNRADDNHQSEVARVGVGRQPGHHAEDFLAIQPHDGDNRAELNHHREHAARIVVAEQALADEQVRRRGHREKLGHALDDSEQGGLDEYGHAEL